MPIGFLMKDPPDPEEDLEYKKKKGLKKFEKITERESESMYNYPVEPVSSGNKPPLEFVNSPVHFSQSTLA